MEPAARDSRFSVSLTIMIPFVTNLHEELLEGLPELAAHAAVDAKVEGIGEADEEVDDERRRVHQIVVEELDDAGRHVVQDDEDAQWNLHRQEHLKNYTHPHKLNRIIHFWIKP